MTTLHQLLETYGRAVALRVAVELGCPEGRRSRVRGADSPSGCGLADRARIERCADEVLADLVARRHADGRGALDAEIVE